MNRSDSPKKQPKPFGVNGQRVAILPTTPAGDNSASYEQGFPPITMILKSAGGLPPKGQDMNQILYELSALGRWSSTGALNTFDSEFASEISGYPSGAMLISDDGERIFINTTEGNLSDPNSNGAGWKDILSYLGLQTIKPDPVSTKIFSPDLKKFLLVSNTSWGMWNNDTGAAIALPVTQGGTGQTTVDGVKAAFGIDKLQPKGNYVITDASTKQSLSDSLSCRYGLEVTDSNNIIRVGIYSTNNQATITGFNGKAIIIPDKAGTMALAGESVSALRLSAPREVTVTTADAWMNFTTSEMVVGIYITPTPGGGAWVLNKVKVATLQAYINGAWVNVTQ